MADSVWRREWDSNPRYGCPYTRFPSVRLQPLGHPSTGRGEYRRRDFECKRLAAQPPGTAAISVSSGSAQVPSHAGARTVAVPQSSVLCGDGGLPALAADGRNDLDAGDAGFLSLL